MTNRFLLLTPIQLSELEVTKRQEISGLLRAAANILETSPSGSRDDSAAWRIADAGLMLRELMLKGGYTEKELSEPTGLGAFLPKKSKNARL